MSMSDYEFISCARCGKAETKEKAVIKCSNCDAGYHLICLKNDTSGFLGDAFFTLTCSSCSDTEEDTLFREKNQWLVISVRVFYFSRLTRRRLMLIKTIIRIFRKSTVVLVLYNLHHQNIGHSRRGYFHWKSHISKTIDDKWRFLMPFGMYAKYWSIKNIKF